MDEPVQQLKALTNTGCRGRQALLMWEITLGSRALYGC